MLNRNELEIKQFIREKGYKLTHKGSPDFLCYKIDKHTQKFVDFIFIEVKSVTTPNLSGEQQIWHEVLKE